MISTSKHLHHILVITEVTTHPTRIQIPTAVIQDILVLVLEIGHLPEKETGSPRTDKVGIVRAGQETEIKVADRAGPLTDNHMGAGQGKNQNIGEGHVLPPIPGVINTTEPQPGQPHQTVSASKATEHPPPATQMIHVPDRGHRMLKECIVHHVTGPPHSSPRAWTAPEAVKDELSNVEKVATGHIIIPKDVRATLSTVAGLGIEEVILPPE